MTFNEDGDVLVALSTSGRSPNILRALDVAGELGCLRIELTGPAARRVDVLFVGLNTDESVRRQKGLHLRRAYLKHLHSPFSQLPSQPG